MGIEFLLFSIGWPTKQVARGARRWAASESGRCDGHHKMTISSCGKKASAVLVLPRREMAPGPFVDTSVSSDIEILRLACLLLGVVRTSAVSVGTEQSSIQPIGGFTVAATPVCVLRRSMSDWPRPVKLPTPRAANCSISRGVDLPSIAQKISQRATMLTPILGWSDNGLHTSGTSWPSIQSHAGHPIKMLLFGQIAHDGPCASRAETRLPCRRSAM
ncbi:MAG: hypothetical protein E6G76_27720 [Alphaproteobacteria bacterium]|nr:MAG: hypothetical protein E6G76_27720 [Alphaproteobacteria bacterium]